MINDCSLGQCKLPNTLAPMSPILQVTRLSINSTYWELKQVGPISGHHDIIPIDTFIYDSFGRTEIEFLVVFIVWCRDRLFNLCGVGFDGSHNFYIVKYYIQLLKDLKYSHTAWKIGSLLLIAWRRGPMLRSNDHTLLLNYLAYFKIALLFLVHSFKTKFHWSSKK